MERKRRLTEFDFQRIVKDTVRKTLLEMIRERTILTECGGGSQSHSSCGGYTHSSCGGSGCGGYRHSGGGCGGGSC